MMRHVVSVAALLAAAGCALATTPRPEDSAAPRDFYSQLKPEDEPRCGREVRLVEPGATLPAHDELSRISVTCSPGAVRVCERRLERRACELGADAVVLEPASAGGVPAGASSQALIARAGRAIRWR